MAYSPVINVPQYHVDGVPASGYVLKAYTAGTSNLLQMATDASGGTLVNTITLNSQGYPSVSGNIVVPHLNAAYKLALYPSQAAADANSGPIWIPDNLSTAEIISNISISGNTISSTNLNGDITLDPNGSGQINLSAVTSATTINAQVVDAQTLELNNVAVTSSAAELNILDGATATAAELNKTDDSAAAVSGYVSGMRSYCDTEISNAAVDIFDIDALVTETTFESVGPTGSGATNIWPAMDSLPANATIVKLKLFHSNTANATAGAPTSTYARQTGTSAAIDDQTLVAYLNTYTLAGSVAANMTYFEAPLDSSRRFDITWTATNDASRIFTLYVAGFIV